ncbi:hypothetical protein PWT90_00679 [Aphanocladium album]|nr:hypothetical protein PWT90_00679 [Aphanocladium album]
MTDIAAPAMPPIASPDTDGKASFMILPVEVRLQIYAYLLHLPPITAADPHEPRVSAAILRASRQIHDEATAVLYNDNTFVAHPSLLAGFPRLRSWYAPVCAAALLPRIRRFQLTVRLDCDLPFDRRSAAAAFSGAEELHVKVSQAAFLGAGYDNLRKLEDVRGVQQLTIRGSTTGFEGYVAWLSRLMRSPVGTQAEDFVPSEEDLAIQTTIMA